MRNFRNRIRNDFLVCQFFRYICAIEWFVCITWGFFGLIWREMNEYLDYALVTVREWFYDVIRMVIVSLCCVVTWKWLLMILYMIILRCTWKDRIEYCKTFENKSMLRCHCFVKTNVSFSENNELQICKNYRKNEETSTMRWRIRKWKMVTLGWLFQMK